MGNEKKAQKQKEGMNLMIGEFLRFPMNSSNSSFLASISAFIGGYESKNLIERKFPFIGKIRKSLTQEGRKEGSTRC